MKRLLKIALTGGIGAGKSHVLRILSQENVPVLQTDKVGHQLLLNKIIVGKIRKKFGNDVLGRNGKIDRRKLAIKVFSDSSEKTKLNGLLHRVIRKKVKVWYELHAKRLLKSRLVVVEVPLVFEGGYYRCFDGVLCVSAPKFIRQNRLLKRGWNFTEIFRRERSQWSQARKSKLANWNIKNRGSEKELVNEARKWLNNMSSLL